MNGASLCIMMMSDVSRGQLLFCFKAECMQLRGDLGQCICVLEWTQMFPCSFNQNATQYMMRRPTAIPAMVIDCLLQ